MPTVLKIIVFGSLALLGGQLAHMWLRSSAGLVGKAPIPRRLLFLAKFATAISLLCVPSQMMLGDSGMRPVTAAVFLILWLGGTAVLTVAFRQLGANLRMGLPAEQTTLVTSGIYRFSRNPIYLGIFCLMAASLVYAPLWLNLVSVLTAVILHHRIVLAEERFLADRFPEFETYRKSVRRYF